MASLDDIRSICRSLPGAEVGTGLQFSVGVIVKGKSKGFVWNWMERVHPKRPKEINAGVVAVVVPNAMAKEMDSRFEPGDLLHGTALRRIQCSSRPVELD